MIRIGPVLKGLATLLALWFLLPLACREEKEIIDKYGQAVLSTPEKARVTVDLSKIRTALEAYRIEHDEEYPPNIKDLNLDLYYPDEYTYDPRTGKVQSKQYPLL